MKPCAVFVLAAGITVAATGCARHYSIVLTNGTQLTAASKPKLEGSYYSYKNASGELQYVAQGRVREISHGTSSSQKPRFINSPARR